MAPVVPLMAVLERLLYQSIASYELGSLHLFTLLSRARAANLRLGITGHLLYSEGRFVQCIEGPPESIARLWEKLQIDDRHMTWCCWGAAHWLFFGRDCSREIWRQHD